MPIQTRRIQGPVQGFGGFKSGTLEKWRWSSIHLKRPWCEDWLGDRPIVRNPNVLLGQHGAFLYLKLGDGGNQLCKLGIRGWIRSSPTLITHRIHGAIYGNIYHQYTPNVSIYTSTMDPSWVMIRPIVSIPSRSIKSRPRHIVIPTSLLKDDATAPLDIWGRLRDSVARAPPAEKTIGKRMSMAHGARS